VAASEIAFSALKVAGAVVLVSLGIQSFVRDRRGRGIEAVVRGDPARGAFRAGLVTCIANPKLAVFFAALFPQFISTGHSTLARGREMSTLIVALDLVWYSVLALVVTRIRRALESSAWGRRLERITGSLMIGLGLRLAVETR
jgi:threonine/homoserine/homoserine lactone efflux protein